MTKKILHIAGCDKFIPPFIKLVKEQFNFDEHEFLLTGGVATAELVSAKNISLSKATFLARLKHYFQTIIKMHQADKIILHGLFDIMLVQILFFTPWLLKKCYWVMWGGDLYTYKLGYRNWKWKIKEFFRRPVIKNIGHLVTYIEGDVVLARKWYKAKGNHHECVMYPSNLYKKYNVKENNTDILNIQVGNSADPTNNHVDALKKLLPYKDENICIYVPLSYGSPEYAKQVIEQGVEWFGSKFKPLTDMLPFNEYLSFLGTIDIAIFNHNRQQAMGNIITLLGLGKTVYIRNDTTQWGLFKGKGIVIRDVEQLNTLERQNIDENVRIIKIYFSQDNCLKQLKILFN